MSLIIENGDIKLDSRGRPINANETEQIVQRALIRLAVRKGSFAPNNQLGSELYRLKGQSQHAMQQAALSFVQEALYPLKEIAVKSVNAVYDRQGDSCTVHVQMAVLGQGNDLSFEI